MRTTEASGEGEGGGWGGMWWGGAPQLCNVLLNTAVLFVHRMYTIMCSHRKPMGMKRC